jgi:uncharacterized protein (TIGR02001 family)
MKQFGKTLAAGSLLALSPLASAEFSGNVALTTDYVWRGMSQTDEQPAIQGGFDYNHDSGFYVGTWASNVDFDDGDQAHIEIDLYAGFGGEFSNGLSWDAGAIYYAYPGVDDNRDYDYWEAYGSLGYDFGPVAVTGGLNYSPNFFGDSDDAIWYYGEAEVPLPMDFTVSAHLGHQDVDDNTAWGTPDWTEWKLAIGKSWNGFDFELAYTDTDLDDNECFGGTELCQGRAVFTVARSL